MKLSEAQISRVVVPKASGLLAGRLRQLILGGDFASGEMMPSERDLVSESGLSRGTVREALKILETEGLVVIRPGRLGGARVKVPQRGDLVRSTEQFLRANQVTLENLFDCRVAIEPMLARLAAIHRTDEELAATRSMRGSSPRSTTRRAIAPSTSNGILSSHVPAATSRSPP
jgi:GntR family transcriptional regulator, transcriptional repressor for pyruvate dehydrogenase complex